MPRVQVNKFHPVQISGDSRNQKTVKNIKGGTCYFNPGPEVSSTVNSGNIIETESVTVQTPMWFVTTEEAETELLVSDVTEVDVGNIGTESLKSEAVTTAKVAAEAVTAPKMSSEAFGKRLVCDYGFVIKAALAESATEPYLLTLAGGAPVLAAAKVAKFGEAVPAIATIPSLMKITGRTSEAELYVIAYPSKAVGTVTITFGIYTISAFGETAAQQELTIATPGKSTAALTNPAAKVGSSATGAAVTLAENGTFVLGFVTSAATAAESLLVGKAQVYVKNK